MWFFLEMTSFAAVFAAMLGLTVDTHSALRGSTVDTFVRQFMVLLLLAHLQELYTSVKDFGLILSQELIRISLTQCQKE